jgi:undecaprenyl-diphosphatase
MNLIEVLILAIVQGITEWLPISSSGHLVLVQQLMQKYNSEWQGVPVLFDVILHLGSLFVVLVAFRRDIIRILRAVAHLNFKSEDGKLALYIIVGSIPTAIIGFLFQEKLESFFSNLSAVGLAFLITGSLLYLSKFAKNKNRTIDYLDSLLIGTAQGVALIPGVSRSGATISTGLLRRVKRERAFQYSFLLFIPAVIGATLAKSLQEWKSLAAANLDAASIFLGLIVTMIVGYVFLKLLFKAIVKEKFHLFAYYCWALGLIIILARVLAVF